MRSRDRGSPGRDDQRDQRRQGEKENPAYDKLGNQLLISQVPRPRIQSCVHVPVSFLSAPGCAAVRAASKRSAVAPAVSPKQAETPLKGTYRTTGGSGRAWTCACICSCIGRRRQGPAYVGYDQAKYLSRSAEPKSASQQMPKPSSNSCRAPNSQVRSRTQALTSLAKRCRSIKPSLAAA